MHRLFTAACLAILALCVPVAVAYPPEAAPFTPTHHEMTLPDPGRRDVPIRVYAPAKPDSQADSKAEDSKADGPFPLIVFSHGAGGDRSAFESLGNDLAAHGYVVVFPTHADSIKLRREQGETIDPRTEPQATFRKVDLRGRAADVRLILDSLDAIEKALERPGLVDRDRLGMAGHSAGAMTTQTLAGVKFFLRPNGPGRSMGEPRFKAFAVISGQGTEKRTFNEHSWEDIDRPMLVMTGSRDSIPSTNETPETRREPYKYAPADGTKYLVFIDGATHGSYQGRGQRAARLTGEAIPDNVEWIGRVTNTAVLAFFDAYVKEDPAAKAWLDAGDLAEIPGGELEFEHK